MATQEDARAVDAVVARLGLKPGQIIQEYGYDSDTDAEFRTAVEAATGEDLVDEDYGDVTDGVVVWFREGEDDLADLLMDAQTLLDDGCAVCLCTPKAGQSGHVQPREVQEAASVAGLHATSTFVIGTRWTATYLVEKGRSK
ncbi:DUF3052 domain-containing protein [Demequina mangrovi]|uniref:DUF3052 domain-containing protein n=1 Tax=Demequina mangrovi TaxID=1043493 RepID=A0A1H6UR16_9MICO|nr:DUF3052 domain-containing protein [Demequina mangrovi]SEI94136.1 Protein of unknown function [Demequina mangrovi]